MRAGQRLLLLVAFLSLHAGCLAIVDESTVQSVRASIRELLSQPSSKALIPTLVRLSFHDCVGGCDGCVDLANPDNNGLRVAVDAIDPIVAQVAGNISRADVWAMAGLEAAYVSQEANGTDAPLVFQFDKWGRVDCGDDATAGPDRAMPDARWDLSRVLDYFNQTFDLTPRETVALMGAHSLGRTRRTNSGFDGPWVTNNNVLTTMYYRELAIPPWVQVPVNNSDLNGISDRLQWMIPGKPPLMMLNADIALFSDFSQSVDLVTGKVTCTFRCSEGAGHSCPDLCPPASTRAVVEEYIKSQPTWISDFEAVFKKMLETVDVQQQGGTTLQAVASAPVAPPPTVVYPPPVASPPPPPSPPASSPPNASPPVASPPPASPPVATPPASPPSHPPPSASPPPRHSDAGSILSMDAAVLLTAVLALCKMMSVLL